MKREKEKMPMNEKRALKINYQSLKTVTWNIANRTYSANELSYLADERIRSLSEACWFIWLNVMCVVTRGCQ